MLLSPILLGLILGVIWCPQEGATQAIRYVPRHGSVSRANSNAYERNVDYGPFELSQGVSNSRAVTKSNGGVRNGGITSIANSNSVTRGVNLGGLDIDSTLTRTQTNTNGAVSRGISHDLNVGNFGIGTSFSPNNLRNGFGLQRSADGGVNLGLGLLNIDLTNKAQQDSAALTKAQVNAKGKNAKVRAGGNTITNTQQYGGVGVTETRSNSRASGRTNFGQTSAYTGGAAGGADTNARTSYYRPRRTVLQRAPVAAVYRAPNIRSRPRRDVDITPFAATHEKLFRVRRQFNRGGGFQQPGFGAFPGGFRQPGFNQKQNANAQGLANNNFGGFNQQAGANTHSNNQFSNGGFFQDNGASGIGSNIAADGTSGQVSSANVAQMNSETADGLSNINDAQSQALNFDPNQQQAASSNAGTQHTRDRNSERIKANSGSQSTNNNQFGTATNIANTNSEYYQDENSQSSLSDASSQSIFQGANGDNTSAFTNSQTSSVNGPDFVSNSASSSATATSNGQGNANANASANSSSGGGGRGGAFTNSEAGANNWRGGGSQANSGSITFPGNFRRVSFRRRMHAPAQYRQFPDYRNRSERTTIEESPHRWNNIELNDLNRSEYFNQYSINNNSRYDISNLPINQTIEQFGIINENERQARTFSFITDFINSLTPCVYPCTLEAFQNNRCCVVVPPPVAAPLPPPMFGPCCYQGRPPMYPPPLPPPPPPPAYPLLPTNCCMFCGNTGLFGPPPCRRAGIYGPQAIINGRSTATANRYGSMASLQTSSASTQTQVTIYVPPPSSLYITTEEI